jgi:shikimate kinase
VLILIGLRASGKTTLGKLLAEHTGRPFTDLDDLTAARLGCGTASEALRVHGVEAFRAAELQALREFLLTAQRDHILALGGGTPTTAAARSLLESTDATIVHLRASAPVLRERLLAELQARPGLTGPDPIAEVDTLLAQRDAIYRAVASTSLEVDAQPTEVLVQALASLRT